MTETEMTIVTALVLGFTGSYHCVAMCGVIAAQTRGHSVSSTLLRHLPYSIGRTSTYALLAFILHGADASGVLSGGQHAVSVVIGAGVIVLTAIRALRPHSRRSSLLPFGGLYGLLARLREVARTWSVVPRSLLFGMLNGVLPCGFVYMALAGALLQPTVERSMMFMTAFGVGTMPALLLLVLGVSFRPLQIFASSPRVRLAASALVGVLLVIRGLAIGIPYLSPSMPSSVHVLSSLKHETTCAPSRP
jgi:hypothetical protein